MSSKDWDEQSLSSLRIHELRDLARKIGVKCPTALKKEDLIEQSMQILNGETEPYVAQNKKGRPSKSQTQVNALMEFFMPETLVDVSNTVDVSSVSYIPSNYELELFASMPEIQYGSDSPNEKVSGLLEVVSNGVGIIRVNNFETSEDDVYIHDMVVSKNKLKSGDYVEAYAKRIIPQRPRAVVQILSVNKETVECKQADSVSVCGKTFAVGSSILCLNCSDAEEIFNGLNDNLNIYVSSFNKKPYVGAPNRVYACVDPFKTYKDIYCCYNMAINRACVLSNDTNVTIVINNLSSLFRALEGQLCDKINNVVKLDKAVKEEIIKMLAKLKKYNVTVVLCDGAQQEQNIKDFFKYELSQIVDYVI